MPHSPVTLTNIVFPLQRPVLPSTPPSYRSQVGDTEGRLGESSSGPSSRCSSRDNTPLDEISDPYARTHPFNTPTSVSPTDIDDKIGIEVDEKIKVDQIGYPGLVPGPKHHARFRSRSIPASLISLRYKLLNKLPFLKPKLDSQNRRSSITLESGHTSPTSPGATFRRDLRRVRKQVYLVMIGTIVSLILIFYAWNIEVLWNGENMRGTMGDWESGWNMTHQGV